MRIDRRTLLVGSGAAGALVVAALVWPRARPAGLLPAQDEQLLGPAIAVGRDGRVRIAVPQAETGQGIWTGLAQVAADALGAAWESVGVVPLRAVPGWNNPLAEAEGWFDGAPGWRPWAATPDVGPVTAGASSIRAYEEPMRRVAAGARSLLVAEAAERWSVPPGECRSEGGQVIHEGKRLPFAALAEGAAARPFPNDSVPMPRGALAGAPLPRLDAAPKADGRTRFAGDVRLPQMLFASLRTSGGRGMRIAGRPPRGVRFVSGGEWVAALAPDWWSAERALAGAAVTSFAPEGGGDAEIEAALDSALAGGEGASLQEVGDVDGAFAGIRPLSASYSAAALLHADLEPPSVTARLGGGRLELWIGTQAPGMVRRIAAEAAGLATSDVQLYPLPVGGQGGRGLEAELVPVAVQLARESGRPVQVTMPRAEQVRTDAVRAPLKARLFARPLPDGSLHALRVRIAGGDGTGAAFARLSGGTAQGRSAALLPLPYAIPNVALELVDAALPLKLGYHRGELHAPLAFFVESFLDELARIGGRDPLSQRMALLAGDPRLAACLVRATALAGWDGGGPGSQMGLCATSAYGSRIAVVAEASVSEGAGVAVSRMVAVVDAGRVINPALVRAQVEGGLIAGIAQTLAPAPSFRHGRPVGPVAAGGAGFAGLPEILVEILSGDGAPGGVNGLGLIAAPAAIGNALAAATGRRLRRLPLDPTS